MAVHPKVEYSPQIRDINHDKRNALGYKINMTAADCPEFFRTRGYCRDPQCNLRHSDTALTGTTTCKFWKNPDDPCHKLRCTYRHVPESELVCAFDGKCNKKFCLYKHLAPRPPLNNMTTIRTNPLSNVKDLEDLLSNYGLQDHHDIFKRKKIVLDQFLGLSERDLKEEFPEIVFGDRLQLIKAIDEYKKFKENKNDSRRDRHFKEENYDADDIRKIFVGGLSYDTTKEDLEKYFNKYGKIVHCVVMINPDSKRSRCFGYVTFDTIDAVNALQEDRPHMIDGKEVETKRATPRGRKCSQEWLRQNALNARKET